MAITTIKNSQYFTNRDINWLYSTLLDAIRLLLYQGNCFHGNQRRKKSRGRDKNSIKANKIKYLWSKQNMGNCCMSEYFCLYTSTYLEIWGSGHLKYQTGRNTLPEAGLIKWPTLLRAACISQHLWILGNRACWILLSPQLCRTSVDMTEITQNLTARIEAEQLTAVPKHCFVR